MGRSIYFLFFYRYNMNKTEEVNNTMWSRLLEGIKEHGQLKDLSIDYGIYTRNPNIFYTAQGSCSQLNGALLDDGCITDFTVMTGDGVTIDMEEFQNNNRVKLEFDHDLGFSLCTIKACIHMIHTPSGENKCTEFYNVIEYTDEDGLPDYATHFSSLPLRYKIPKEFNKDLESALSVKFPNLFRVLRHDLKGGQVSLHIIYFPDYDGN